ncbi:hypothetical protein [Xanthomonas fragariae]|uniref:hypothetical protein n=1 Tax=Xanthomonas fragariae TaxID=48664 RepID=UPI0022AA1ABB|nr:hypothetical protein [Xanthomonas fragariae]WAT15269.1 hypothetical protein OZ429_01680 [Xanthomonas fragariae]
MLSPKNSNRRKHAQSTYQSLPEQAAGRPASSGAVAPGMSSPSAPSGVLTELQARPTKRPRNAASAARSAPESGAHPAPNGTSIPFPFALHYDDLPCNSHVHPPHLSRADAPEPQGTTVQQPASEDAAVHEERQAQVDCPSTSRDMRSEFAKLRNNLRNGTRWSSYGKPYPDDTALIERFVESAENSAHNFHTIRDHVHVLIRFSAWLSNQNKGGLQGRLLQDSDELRSDAMNFQTQTGNRRLIVAVDKLHNMASAKDGTIKTRPYRRNDVPESDKKLINDALSATPAYVTALRAFSGWLHAENKKALCETGRLHSQALMDDARAFKENNIAGSHHLISALRQLQNFYLTGKTDFANRINTREIPEVDRQLYQQYKDILSTTLSASGPEKKYGAGQTYSGKMSGLVHSFSGWLKANQKEAMATRLHDTTLDDDLNIFTNRNCENYAKTIKSMLKQVRDIFPCDVQSPEQGNKPQAHDVDRQLSEQFIADFLAPGRETTSIDQEKYASLLSAHVRHFSAWLRENEKEPLASRLHKPTLDRDLELYIRGKGLGYKSVLKHMLMQVRQMYPSNEQLPDLGSRAEPAELSYSSMFPLTPEGGWPQAAEGDWIPDTPEEEVTGPASSAQPEASSYNIPFDWEAPYQEATEPQHTIAMSQASILSFDEKDTGPSWKRGVQQVPEWLLQHEVRDTQMVRIRGIAYRVVTKQREVDGVNQAQLWLNPEQF